MNKLFTIAFIFISAAAFCQAGGVAISATGSAPAASAMLDISSTKKGVLLPRLSQTQRDSISNPDFGLMILNTSTNCFNVWLGATWKQLCGDCDFGNPVPGNSGPICEGQTLNLTATTILGATYHWTGPNGFVSNLQNPTVENATAGASGSYSVQATLNGCTTQPQSTVATVNAIPQTPTATNSGPVCVGQNLNLMATTIVGASYTWSGPNNFSDNSQNPIIANAQTNQGGNYNVIASVSGCNSAPGSMTAVVNATPSTPGNISGLASICPNATGKIYAIASVFGATSYNWTVPSGASINGNSDTAISVTFGNNPTGNITVSATNTCGTSGQSSLSISQQSVCSPMTFNATSTGYTGSLQTFTIPVTSTYTIQAFGAAGGASGAQPGGEGAIMKGDFNLTQGQQLSILVGQAGATATGAGGGGGGTFVVLFGTPLIVAGGGGGGGGNYGGGYSSYPGEPGLTTTTAGTSTGGNNSTGGTANSAGTASSGNYSGGAGGGGTCCDGGAANFNGGLGGGGGAGFGGNGGPGPNGPVISYSFNNGGYGGYHPGDSYGSSSNSYGGYGGGGCGEVMQYNAGGGGGGGYTGGGGGCGYQIGGGGGGGGSYNNGANQTNQQGAQSGDGKVIITW